MVTQGHRYSFSILGDTINGIGEIAIFDPSNGFAQVGSTISASLPTGGTFSQLRFGDDEAGQDTTATITYFEDIMIDATNHKFPNHP